MNRIEFMSELEYLLQDIPEEEKAEALAYYRDYLEDAGDENEEQVIREFASPERVAAIIRSDLSGSLESGGEFTEAGYQDERFKDPNYQVVQRRHLPEVSEPEPEVGWDSQTSSGKRQKRKSVEDTTAVRFLKVGLLLLAIIIAAPVLLGLGGGALGMAVGAVILIVVAIVLVGVLTITACIVAVSLLVVGFGLAFTQPWGGMLVLGLGTLALGLACIGIGLSILIYGKFLPFCIRSIVNAVSSLFHRERRSQT